MEPIHDSATPAQRALNLELVNAYGENGIRLSVESGSLILQVPTVDALIEELCKFRAEMKPGIPQQVNPTKKHLVEMDPGWHAEYNALLDGSVLLLRHSGLGWTCFALPRASVEKLIEVLSHHLEMQKQAEAMPN